MGKFSIFNLLRGRFTLLPSFRSLPHYALLKTQTQGSGVTFMKWEFTQLVTAFFWTVSYSPTHVKEGRGGGGGGGGGGGDKEGSGVEEGEEG